MIDRSLTALILAGIVATVSASAHAQSAQPPLQDRWPAPTQQLEQQTTPPAPDAATQPAQAPAPAAAPEPNAEAPKSNAEAPKPNAEAPKPSAKAPAAKPAPGREQAKAKKPAAKPTTVACGGVFAPDSRHEALESAYGAKNVTFTEVESDAAGPKLMATVIFPNDPKRRLEVVWRNEDARADIHRIAITGHSTWTGPKGLRLGMSLAAVEKINGKPFKLQGFDQSNSSATIDWQDGALASLPGGCDIGVFFAANPKAPQAAREEAAADHDFLSSDGAIRAVKPVVTEILFGYGQ
jgi:hypothetical protein